MIRCPSKSHGQHFFLSLSPLSHLILCLACHGSKGKSKKYVEHQFSKSVSDRRPSRNWPLSLSEHGKPLPTDLLRTCARVPYRRARKRAISHKVFLFFFFSFSPADMIGRRQIYFWKGGNQICPCQTDGGDDEAGAPKEKNGSSVVVHLPT